MASYMCYMKIEVDEFVLQSRNELQFYSLQMDECSLFTVVSIVFVSVEIIF